FAALDDQVVGVAAGDDFLGAVGRSTQHAHGMIVRQQDVLDGLVGHFFDAADDILRHDRCGLGIDDHDGFVADDDARVGIAFGRVGVGVVGQLFKGYDLVVEVGVGCKLFAHVGSPVLWLKYRR